MQLYWTTVLVPFRGYRELHRDIWKMLMDRREKKLLFRVGELQPDNCMPILIQSQYQTRVPPVNSGVTVKSVLQKDIPIGKGLRFRFSADVQMEKRPAQAKTEGKPRKVSRVFVTDAAEQREWFQFRVEGNERRGMPKAGELVGELKMAPRMLPGLPSRWGWQRVEGVIDVTNPEQMTHLIQHGIGRGDVFGCGLVLLEAV
jgi:CRISPR-associated protein Cas6/Cse3/CasE subtype I-E